MGHRVFESLFQLVQAASMLSNNRLYSRSTNDIFVARNNMYLDLQWQNLEAQFHIQFIMRMIVKFEIIEKNVQLRTNGGQDLLSQCRT